MSTEIPVKYINKIQEQVVSDPGLPRENPTVSYWQLPPHKELSTIQHEPLIQRTDVAIIGSGVTGVCVAKSILERNDAKDQTITVLEARTLASGASGRNGGGLASHVPYIFSSLVERLGKDRAIELASFTYRTLEKMHALGTSNEQVKAASEIRRTREVQGFLDEETWEATRDSFQMMVDSVPDLDLDFEVIDAETAMRDFNVKTVGGLLRFNSGAFWPYRFVTTFWQQLYAQHGGTRLFLETNTPVTSIATSAGESAYPYILSTPRGPILAKNIVHATNGYASHLLPQLRGKIFPMKGFMSAQGPGSNFDSSHSRSRTWSFFGSSTLDPSTGVQETGVYYGNHSPGSGAIFWGSDQVPIDQWITADDAEVHESTRLDLNTALPKLFPGAWAQGEEPFVHELWAGVMGYTADHMPIVGRLPASAVGREGNGEYIAAGFNGAGMCQIWSSGEALVKIMFGESVEGLLPALYLASEERFSGPGMSASSAVQSVVGEGRKH